MVKGKGRLKNLVLSAAVLLIFGGGVAAYVLSSVEEQPSKTSSENSSSSEQKEQPESDAFDEQSFSEGIKAKQTEFESKAPEYPDLEGDPIVYSVNNDGSTTPELHPADAQLLDIVKSLAPSETVFKSIKNFEVYFSEEDGVLASVASEDDTNSEWTYSINYTAVTEFSELIPTIVHEFAHILALQDSQTTTEFEIEDARTSCENFLVAEGCLNEDSYLQAFYKKFWKDTMAAEADGDRSEQQAAEFFEEHSSEFVSEYATTNAVEDFAESFMTYVTSDYSDESGVKKQKVDFFADFESLKKYRAEVLGAIGDWAS